MAKASAPAVANPLVMEVVAILQERGQTVSFAESCTGGLLSAVFTRLPGVSNVYAGSVVAYSYAVKERLLDVPESMLRTLGAVSLPVAKRMAVGVRAQLDTTWALSITGIAGPGGGTPEKPVGTVCLALAGPGVERAVLRRFAGSRREVQMASARFALRMLLHALGGAGVGAGEVTEQKRSRNSRNQSVAPKKR